MPERKPIPLSFRPKGEICKPCYSNGQKIPRGVCPEQGEGLEMTVLAVLAQTREARGIKSLLLTKLLQFF